MKICKLCEKEKIFDEFYKDKSTSDGHTRRCKLCSKKTNASGYVKNKEKHQERNKKWYEANKDSADARNMRNYWLKKEERNEKSAEWYDKNKEKINKQRKERRDNDIGVRIQTAKKVREWRKNNIERSREYSREYAKRWRRNNKEKMSAVNKLNHSVFMGRIERKKHCQACGKEGRTEAHHHNYEKPLDVIWLCKGCHTKIHRGTYLGET